MKRLFFAILFFVFLTPVNIFSQVYILNIHEGDTVKYHSFDYNVPFVLQIKENVLNGTKDGSLNVQVTTDKGNEYLNLKHDSIPYVVDTSTYFQFDNSLPSEWKFEYTTNSSDSGYVILIIEQLTPKYLNKP